MNQTGAPFSETDILTIPELARRLKMDKNRTYDIVPLRVARFMISAENEVNGSSGEIFSIGSGKTSRIPENEETRRAVPATAGGESARGFA